jgi:uncharacterized protein (TIGR02001 family)
MNEPTGRDEIHGGRGAGRIARHLHLIVTGALAVTIASTGAPTAKAQQSGDLAAPAPALVVKAPLAAETPVTDSAIITLPANMPPTSAFDAKFAAAVTSDYNYRGYTLSDHLPSVSANVEATYDILFASVNTASVQMPDLSHFQMTDTIGLRRAFGALMVETGGAIYSYPSGANDPSYAEVYVSPSYTVTKQLTVGLNVFYAPDYYRMGAWENYDSLTAKYDIGWGLSFSGELGHQFFGTTRATAISPAIALPDYTYGNAGFSYTYKSLTFDLRYHATTLSKQSCFLITGTATPTRGSNGCDPAVIATLSWNAGLSDVKSSLAGLK